jgi:hypothetical protein
VLSSLILSASFVLMACGDDDATGGGDGHRAQEELSDFIVVAEDADCARDVNRLYRIDRDRVLWQREDLGCADAAYAITLYGSTPDVELCSSFQTIGGPITECRDERAHVDFDTILAHLDDPDLGLGGEHAVELVWNIPD